MNAECQMPVGQRNGMRGLCVLVVLFKWLFCPEQELLTTAQNRQESQGNDRDFLWSLTQDAESNVQRDRFSQSPGRPGAAVLKSTLTTAFPSLPRPAGCKQRENH